jgi:DNA uptake protein ComE-like DNA-binding protein
VKSIHRHIIRISLLFAGWSLALLGVAQKDQDFEKQNIIEQRIEAIASATDENTEIDFTNLFEDLSNYYDRPLDLNTASAEQLQELYLLSDLQIRALQQHIEKFGPLQSIYELQAVRLFDLPTIRLIQPFVALNPPSLASTFTFKNMFKEGTNDWFFRYKRTMQKQAGFLPDIDAQEPASYLGSPDYLYTRYRFQYRNNVIAGFTMEKDAGEQLTNGPDFLSAHLFIRNNGFVKTIALGDFQAQFGQGLTFWNGLGFGKSPFVMNVKKNANGLRPYTSVNESLFLRGAAATFKLKQFELTTLASYKKIDGNAINNVDSTFTDDNIVVSSLQISGFHRTEGELADKGAITEHIGVANLKYATRTFHLATTAAYVDYSLAVAPGDQLYEVNKFSGSKNTNIGIDYQKVFRNINFFGEGSRSANGGLAMLNGFVASLHSRISVSAVHRFFGNDYQAQYFNVFQESSRPQNERGMFIGLEALIAKGWTLSAYSDQIVYPWLRFQVQAPSHTSDYLTQLSYKPDRKQEIYFRYRVRNGVEDLGGTDRIDYPVTERQQNFRLNAIYTPHPDIQMRTRAEWNVYEKYNSPRSTGFLLLQDLIWKKMGSKVSLNLRYALFNTPNYDTRIYAYESDVLYAFSIPGYYGRGTRAYAMMKWDIRRGVDLWVRYAQWVYEDRTTISSGNSAIEGNKRGDFSVQLRWQF